MNERRWSQSRPPGFCRPRARRPRRRSGRDQRRGSGDRREERKPTIVLANNSWEGSVANNVVAQYVIEKNLGYNVNLLTIDEIPAWPAMAQGKVSAVMEVWGHSPLYAQYVKGNHKVVDAGLEGPDGNIGWYVPTYLLQAAPRAEDLAGREEGLEAVRHAAVVAAGSVPRRLAELRHERRGAREEPRHQPQGRLRRHRGRAADRDRVRLQGEEAGALLLVHAAVSRTRSTSSRRSHCRRGRRRARS